MAAPRRTLLAILLVALCAATAVLAAPIQTYAVANAKTTSCSTTLMLKAVGGTSQYGPDISPVAVTATYITADTLEVRIFDPTNSRWEVPEVFVPRPDGCFTGNVQIAFTFIENPFSFAIARVNGGSVLFNSSTSPSSPFNGLIFEDQYLELSTQLPSGYHLYGLGEEVLPLLRNYSANPIATLWARDQGTPVGTNLYGSHPFYMEMRPPGLAHGVFLLNSNGMDVALNATSLTYRVIGGVLDLFFFAGPTPLAVTQQYHALIGRPKMPPYWGLGWHQCRWGYPNLETVEQVVANYSAAGIPLETMWTDIDYMDNFLDFTTSPTNYPTPNMTAFVQGLHAKHQHYVVIVDPGIHNITGYAPYDQGIAQDVFLHSADGSVYIGHVWPGSTAFPDWLAPNTSAWWANQIAAFRAAVPVDGLWIDMNEISNFCNGDCATGRLKRTNTRKGLGFDPNNPPYAINNGNDYDPLDTKTVPMDLTHRLDGTTTVEYNIHSLFGLSEQMLTCAALEAQTNQRCFVISRSTYPSSGTHGGHWLGDNVSTWADLYYSIPGTLNMQLYGIPLVGADVCGFGGVTTEELCGRWMQLGSLYPFSRNHNSFGEPSQEPYVWPSVANVSRFALAVKYSLLPYYYTQFYNASTSGGAMVWRPVFFVFPTDANTWAIDQQFMIGDGILATPVLTQGASTVVGYFPPSARWFDFYTHVQLSVPASGFVTLPAPYGAPLPLHIRGGAILPMQGAAYTTTASRLLPFSFIVALDANGAASGGVYVDDGASINVGTNFTLLAATAASTAKGGSVYFNGQRGYTGLLSVNQITVLGLGAAPKTAAVNSVPIPASAIAWNQAASSATFAFLTSFNALASLTWTS